MFKPIFSKVCTWITILQNLVLKIAGNVIEMAPPHDLTVTRLSVIEVRIRDYWKTYGRLPDNLSDLPILKGRDSATVDGWGRAIKYEITGTSKVTLSSSGSDGTSDDEALNQDIVVSFDVE